MSRTLLRSTIRSHALMLIAALLLTAISTLHIAPSTTAVAAANIVVTNVYWGSNPLAPSTARPGDVNVQLSVVLTNAGDDVARGINATLFLSPPLRYTYYLDGKEHSSASVSKVAGDIIAGSSSTIGFVLAVEANAKEGIYRFKLELSYMSARELQQTALSTMIDVPIWKGELRVQKASTTPAKIYPGSKQVLVEVTIVNSGKGTASRLPLRIDLKHPFKPSSSGSDKFYLGSLLAGQVAEIEFMVDVLEDAPFGQYSIVLAEEHDTVLTPIDQIPLYVEEKVIFQIVRVEPQRVEVGAKGVLVRIELKNAGSVKADSVRAQLLVGNFFTGTLTDFLGTMLPGEGKAASFTVDIDSKAQERQHEFDLRIDWSQDDNPLDQTLRLSLNLQSGEGMGIAVPLGIVLVVICIGYVVARRRGVRIPPFWRR